MILCNGIPKSGTHALIKAVQLLGEPNTLHDHVPYTPFSLNGIDKHIYITRDLRNVLVSWVRFTRDNVTPGFLICAIKNFYENKSLSDTVKAFSPWENKSNVLSVKFENLISDSREMRRIAHYLNIKYLHDAHKSLKGGTATWTGKLSNWQEHWTDDVENEWNKHFGISNTNQRQAIYG